VTRRRAARGLSPTIDTAAGFAEIKGILNQL
jgi:hypothetical protein